MDYIPHRYTNHNGLKPSFKYLTKRCLWFNSDFFSDFVLIDGLGGTKIYEISFDTNPFEIYKFNRLKVLTYIRDSNQSKPIQIKLKLPLTQSREVYNMDKESYPIIYSNHTAVESIQFNNNYSIRLIPQQIPRFTFRLDENYNQLDYNSYFTSVTNGSVFQVASGSPDDKYIIFNTNGSFVLDKNLICDILVVGGGGGGSTGGGGAGQVVYKTNQLLLVGTYTIIVGAGGAGLAPNSAIGGRASDGNDSAIQLGSTDIIRAYKGGGAPGNTLLASVLSPPYGSTAGNGINSGGVQNIFPAGNVLGFTGGLGGAGTSYNSGGGGGGAGERGENGTAGPNDTLGSGAIAGRGGNGIQVPITGVNIYYGGGGGGGTNINNTTGNTILNRPAGGLGGGGAGSRLANEGGLNAEPNTGGGGGGGDWEATTAGNGGSGVVIIRFSEKRIEGITPEETLIQTTNASIPVTINSKYQINYQTPVDLPKGTYESIFNNGGIIFKSKPDYNYPITSKSPIVWYKFDIYNLLIDSSGNNYNLTNINNTTTDINNFVRGNGSANFIASSAQYFNMPKLNYQTINTTNGISFSFWGRFKSTTGTYASPIQLFGTGYVNPHFIMYRDDANNFAFYNNNSTDGTRNIATSGINHFDNTWRHYVWTISTSGVWNTYVNATINGANNYAGNIMRDLNASTSYTSVIGRRLDTNHNIDGNIDDFRIYDYVLSPNEIYDLYNGTSDRSYPILKDTNNNIINPLAWYQFDNSSNNMLNDSSGNGYILTNPNGVTFSSDYIKGNGSASFDGINDVLENTNAFNLNSKDFSISVWVKKTDNLRTDFVLTLGSDSPSNYTLLEVGYIASNKIRMGFYGNDLDTTNTYTDAGIWTHLVFTYKTGTKVRKIYRNGSQVDTNSAGAEITTTSHLKIGKKTNSGEYFKGLMDDLRIYNIELSATQVSELYNGRVSIYNPPGFMLGLQLEDEKLKLSNTISTI